MKLKIRCPACAKLYEVERSDIHSEMPTFACISCDSRFSFEYPPLHPDNVDCFLLPTKSAPAVSETSTQDIAQRQEVLEPAIAELKACPKCGALNGRRSKECYSCHVIFERLEGLPTDPSLKAQPSLVRKWKNLVQHFENEDLHEQFIMSCHELDALRFAILKYEELRAAQGGDPQCDRMIARVNSLMTVGLQQQLRQTAVKSPLRPKWQKYIYWGPFALSALFILLGMINLGHRNLIGVGVALSFMAAGLIVMIRGRISAADFFD